MKVFTELDKEQADMFRWVRRNMTPEFFAELTGKLSEGLTSLEVDVELREAYYRDRAGLAAKRLTESSKLRTGVLPESLGLALDEYTRAVQDALMFTEGLNSKTYKDMDEELKAALLNLCDEMSKLVKV